MKIPLILSCSLAAAAQAAEYVTYEEFGAVGNGKADDQDAIVAAHAAANERGLPVKAGDGKTYYIGRGAKVAVIMTDVDFGTASFVIDDRDVENLRAPSSGLIRQRRPLTSKASPRSPSVRLNSA